MSLTTQRNRDTGPLNLQHDPTPRDPLSVREGKGLAEPKNHKYKGYAEGFFLNPKEPIVGSTSDKDNEFSYWNTPGEVMHSLPHHFDPRNPRAFGKTTGLQYGSDDFPTNEINPQPIRGSLLNKSSADVRRFEESQRLADEEFRKFKEDMMQKKVAREDERKQDWEMLKSYDPWGKPGGGAPIKVHHKKQKFTEYELHDRFTNEPPPEQKELLEEYGNYNDYFGRPGAGAPLRHENGELYTQVKQAPDIRFVNTEAGRQIYERELRYRKHPTETKKYFKDLDLQIKQRNLVEQEGRIEDMKKELEMLKHDPFGRPGAGAPNKPYTGEQPDVRRHVTMPNNSYNEFRRTGPKWEQEEQRRALSQPVDSQFQLYDPWGKGAMQPSYDHRGDTVRHQFSKQEGVLFTEKNGTEVFREPDEQLGTSLNLQSPRGGAGAPLRDRNGIRTRLPITMKRDDKGDITVREEIPGQQPHRRPPRTMLDDEEYAVYDPWSKPGAGAPLKNDRGDIVTNVYGNFNTIGAVGELIPTVKTKEPVVVKLESPRQQPVNTTRSYLKELQNDSERSRNRRKSHDYSLKFGEGELAEVMKQGQVGQPKRDPNTGLMANNHLPTTDVTREVAGGMSFKADDPKKYHTDLDRAAVERRRLSQLDKLREQQEARQHSHAMNDFWGRPGGGAPKGSELQKKNLDDILHSPRKEADYYNKTLANGQKPTTYIKNTVQSDHKNQYEVNSNKRRQEYDLRKPFATYPDE